MTRRRRRGTRIRTEQDVELVTSDGHVLGARLKDVSSDGFKVRHGGADLIVGEIVTIRSARSEGRAQLQWVTTSDAGGTFIEIGPQDRVGHGPSKNAPDLRSLCP